jgi:energy-coupling factor transporter ATP-binding protein EcfA2
LITRIQELCRQLKPVLGAKVDRLWSAYLAESDADGKADIEQTLELLAAKHLGKSYEPDRSPFPPPSKKFAGSGDIKLGTVSYGGHDLYPFYLKSDRLKEHILVAGRSGSGKTNLTFVLMEGIMASQIKVLALDWKRGYRDLVSRHADLRVFTIGREVAPFRFNPLIPPAGCEPHLWIKLIVDVIASAYLGGEGVISLLVAGLDHLYSQFGVFDETQRGWPTIQDLLAWLRTAKLKGRAAMWQASAERILLGMTYGEFGAVLNTQDNSHVAELLDHNVVLEMDGLSSASDKVMFSEALTLYLYRYRLAQGPQKRLTNVVILEEAHNLLLKKSTESKESVLETSIRMVRQYGLGYVFVDQSASLLSKVAFANSYATLALSQKLRSDVQAIAGAMNLTDEQKEALNTLPIGTAVIRLADEHPEPFLVKIPLCPIREGSISDVAIRAQMGSCYGNTASNRFTQRQPEVISPIPPPDKESASNRNHQEANEEDTRPPSPEESAEKNASSVSKPEPPRRLSPEERRFLIDIIARPLSTTVSRYHRLNLSRRRGNAVQKSLDSAHLIERVAIATHSG